jgi:hypothetical protein
LYQIRTLRYPVFFCHRILVVTEYLTTRCDRKRPDLFRRNPVRNPLVRNLVKAGWVPIVFNMESGEFRINLISDLIVSGRTCRSDRIIWAIVVPLLLNMVYQKEKLDYKIWKFLITLNLSEEFDYILLSNYLA